MLAMLKALPGALRIRGHYESAALTIALTSSATLGEAGKRLCPSMKASVLSSKKFKTAKNLKQFKKARKNF